MSDMRFNWSITAIPVDPEFVPSDEVLEAARALYGGMSLCTTIRPRPVAVAVAERHATARFYGSELFSYGAGPVGSHDEAVVAMGDWIKASGAPAQGSDLQVLREVAARFPQSRAGRLAATLIG